MLIAQARELIVEVAADAAELSDLTLEFADAGVLAVDHGFEGAVFLIGLFDAGRAGLVDLGEAVHLVVGAAAERQAGEREEGSESECDLHGWIPRIKRFLIPTPTTIPTTTPKATPMSHPA